MKIRSKITLILSVAVLAAPLLSGIATDCEQACCVEQENVCTLNAVKLCPNLEAALPIQQQPPVLQQSSGKSVIPPIAIAVSARLLYAHYNYLPVNMQALPKLTVPLTIPLIV